MKNAMKFHHLRKKIAIVIQIYLQFQTILLSKKFPEKQNRVASKANIQEF